MKPTELSLGQWNRLHYRLSRDYPDSYLLIRSTMRRELGFTVRRHSAWQTTEIVTGTGVRGYYRDCIYMDWYDEVKRTFFMLKYSEYLES